MECFTTSRANTSWTSNNFQQENRTLFKNIYGSNNEAGEPYELEAEEQIILDIFGRLNQPFEELEKH